MCLWSRTRAASPVTSPSNLPAMRRLLQVNGQFIGLDTTEEGDAEIGDGDRRAVFELCS
jgi:hypothetical protein